MKTRASLTIAGLTVLAVTAAGCSGSSSGSGDADGPVEIEFWASQQAPSIALTEEALQPVLDAFEEESGIHVKLEVVDWANLTNRTLTAASTGVGPDVINIGNSNATTFQATGAFLPFGDEELEAIGGSERFVPASFATGGAEGQPPTSIPYIGYVYGLYYNKNILAEAGVEPPTSWEELTEVAQQVTDPDNGVWGLSIPGGMTQTNMHMAFILGTQDGGAPFDSEGSPTFTDPGLVDGIQRYIDLIGSLGVVNPADAQNTDTQQPMANFVDGKSAMLMGQNDVERALRERGLTPDDYGIVPIPTPIPLPSGGEDISSFVGGINISIFKNTEHKEAALEFVKYITSPEAQEIIDVPFGALPVNTDGVITYTDNPVAIETFSEILANRVTTFPRIPTFAGFTANVGGAVTQLVAQAATTGSVSRDDIVDALQEAQEQFEATN